MQIRSRESEERKKLQCKYSDIIREWGCEKEFPEKEVRDTRKV